LRKRFWEQTVPMETEIEEITYSCPDCGEVILTVPLCDSVPEEKVTLTCSKGHKIKLPKYKEFNL
jgi:hypothetical protein